MELSVKYKDVIIKIGRITVDMGIIMTNRGRIIIGRINYQNIKWCNYKTIICYRRYCNYIRHNKME